MINRIKTVAVHWEEFHADDVFAVAILKMIYPKINIWRTEYRDLKKQNKADLRVDVGRLNDPSTGDFDHHQPGGAGKRLNGVPYASCGLIWKTFGIKLAGTQEIVDYIDRKLIQTIDSIDNGYNSFISSDVMPYTISSLIHSMNPSWPNQTMADYNRLFKKAVNLAMDILNREIGFAKSRDLAIKEVQKTIDGQNGDYLILDKDFSGLWVEPVAKTKFLFVIEFSKSTKTWYVNAVSSKEGSFERRAYLPSNWAGLENEKLQNISGIRGAVFCHIGLHFAVTKTRADAIKMVDIALKSR